MFKEFNVEFQDVEMIGGADNLLENTKVTKVVMSGDNKMSSLDSAFKNCSELDNIQGGLDLNGVSNIDNILEGNSLIKNIDLKNVNNENISANNSFPNIEEITIGGELYNKKALQNVIASKEWTFDNITYSDVVGDNVTIKEVNVVDDNKLVIKDTLEQKAKEIEIKGQTYQNLIEGKGEYNLTDTYSATWTESNSSFEDIPDVVEIPEIWGNTVQGYANAISSHMIKTSLDGINGRTVTVNSNGSFKFSHYNLGINESTIFIEYADRFIQLKSNTTYSICLYDSSYNYYSGNLGLGFIKSDGSTAVLNTTWKSSSCYAFTTDSTGKIFIFPWACANKDLFIRIVEGEIDLSKYKYNEYDLNYIQSVGDLYVDEEGNPILDEEGNEQYILELVSSDKNTKSNKTTILMPQPLRRVAGVSDRLYWDFAKNKYVIESRIGEFTNVNDLSQSILPIPILIETNIANKVQLETYSPVTYISTNTEVEPSQMIITSKKTMLTPSQLQANKEYTLQFECKEKGDNSIKFSLGGTEKEIDATLGVNHINITTLNELSNNDLVLSGQGNKISDVMLIEGDMKQYPEYFEGIQSVGNLQENGKYKIDIKTNEDFIVSIKTNLPLTKDDKLYWNDTNKRYEIDRSGEIEVPAVEGDIIDLPRLYQRDNTTLTVSTDNINPSEIKVKHKDLN